MRKQVRGKNDKQTGPTRGLKERGNIDDLCYLGNWQHEATWLVFLHPWVQRENRFPPNTLVFVFVFNGKRVTSYNKFPENEHHLPLFKKNQAKRQTS